MAIVNTNKLEVTKLDFHGIRDSLKTFLQGQTEFNDYDFDGSGLGAILDLLSYNTHYLAFYLNMVANEMFLDTASQRSSVVGIARQLGYTPKSARGALAAVNFTLISSTGAAAITVPKWTPFSITVEKDKFLFYTVEPKTMTTVSTSAGNEAPFIRLPIKEGIYVKNTWTYNSQGKKQRFIMDNQYIDTTTMSVTVKASKSTGGTGDTYTLYKDLITLDSTSQVYFLQEVEDGKYEIYFGDGIYGKALSDENVITVDYLTTNGSVANFAGKNDSEQFSLLTTINDGNGTATEASGVTIIGNGFAAGGTLPESLSSIKFNAPLSYAAQDRAVTANDYKNILLSNYGNIRGVKVWGGRPKIGMRYSGLQEKSGTVYICILPKHGDFLPRVTKDYVLKTILSPYKILGIKNEIVDPKFVKLLISLEVIFNPSISELSEPILKKKIINSVIRYGMTDLDVFDGKFRHSVLSSVVNNADPSIVAIKKMIVRFKIDLRFDYNQVQTREPGYGTQNGTYEAPWDRVIFPSAKFGLSIEPSTQGGGVRTNKFYVWAQSLPNYLEEQQQHHDGRELPENLWMKSTELFAWSMKRTDSGGKGDVEIHSGMVIECYFKDDGYGRINLYSVKDNKKIPYHHLEGSYANSSELSWIEGQASAIGWETVRDSVKNPGLRKGNRVDNDILTSWFKPLVLDYESWGTVNYELGSISNIKPIAILGMSGDIKFLLKGTISKIGILSYWNNEKNYRGIELERNIQSLEWHAFQYTGQDVSLGGYNAAGNNVMKLDSTYLTKHIKLHSSADKPSPQIGTRLSATKSTEELDKNFEKPLDIKTPAAPAAATLDNITNLILSAAPEGSSGHTGPASQPIVNEILTEDDEQDTREVDEEKDKIVIEKSKQIYSKIVVGKSGTTWMVQTYSKFLTDGTADALQYHGYTYVMSGQFFLPQWFLIYEYHVQQEETKSDGPNLTITNATVATFTPANASGLTTEILDAVTVQEGEGEVIIHGPDSIETDDETVTTPDKQNSGKGKSFNNPNTVIKIEGGLIPLESPKDDTGYRGAQDVSSGGIGNLVSEETQRVVHWPDLEEMDYYRYLPGNWVFYEAAGDHGLWYNDAGSTQNLDGSATIVLSDETMTKQTKSDIAQSGGDSDESNNVRGGYYPGGTVDYNEPITIASFRTKFTSAACGSRWDLNNDNVVDITDVITYDVIARNMTRLGFQMSMGQEYGKDYGPQEKGLVFKGSC